jgi:NitT/TauT family transport system permease protein
MKRFLKILLPALTFMSLIIIWELIANSGEVSKTILTPPTKILPVVIENHDIIFTELVFTAVEVLLGWFVGGLIGVLLATLIYRNKSLSSLLINLSVLINSVPLIALAAILGGILGTGQAGKSVIVGLVCFFPMFISALKAFVDVDSKFVDLFKTYGANERERFIKLIVPSGLPLILNTLKVNVLTAISTAVVAEFFGAHGGIGNLILAKRGLYELEIVWGAIFYIIIAGGGFYLFIEIIRQRVVPWRN